MTRIIIIVYLCVVIWFQNKIMVDQERVQGIQNYTIDLMYDRCMEMFR